MVLRFALCVCLLCFVQACKRSDQGRPARADNPEPVVQKPAKTPVKKPAQDPPTQSEIRRKLPPPLRPGAHVGSALIDSPGQPCALLVNKVCALLSEGAEECGTARTLLRTRPATLDHERCAAAMAWYARRVKDARLRDICVLLARATCSAYGEDSMNCINARADLRHMNKPHARKASAQACRAELLLLKGLAR